MPGRGRGLNVSADPPGPELGERFPFLSPFTYRTLGWQWTFEPVAGRNPQQARLRSLGHLAGSILERFLADVLECKTSEMLVDLDLVECRLRFLDATPGGSGLAETLLREDRFREALRRCLQILQKLVGPSEEERYRRYILDLCQKAAEHTAEEVAGVLGSLLESWSH